MDFTAGMNLGMGSANGGRRYNATSSLIGWAYIPMQQLEQGHISPTVYERITQFPGNEFSPYLNNSVSKRSQSCTCLYKIVTWPNDEHSNYNKIG